MSSQDIFLPDLPVPDVVQILDYEAILSELKTQFNAIQPNLIDENSHAIVKSADLVESTNGERYWKIPVDKESGLFYLDLESDPVTRLLEVAAYRELLLRQRINDAALAVMPAYCKGSDQDELFKVFGLERLMIKEPTDTEFAIYEPDEAFRRRYALALDQFTTAGSEESYLYHALSADGRVKDASGYSPSASEVVITILGRDGSGIAPSSLLAIVSDALNDKKTRPIADQLIIQSAEIIRYSINVCLILNYGPSPEPVLELARKNLNAFVQSHHKLGADIELTAIAAKTHLTGVHRVEFDMSLPIRCEQWQAPFCTGINVAFGGRDA